MKLVLFIVFLVLSFFARAENLFIYNSPILAEDLNVKFNSLQLKLLQNNIAVQFQHTFSQGQIITKEDIKSNLDQITDVFPNGIEIDNYLSNQIKSEEFNNLFNFVEIQAEYLNNGFPSLLYENYYLAKTSTQIKDIILTELPELTGSDFLKDNLITNYKSLMIKNSLKRPTINYLNNDYALSGVFFDNFFNGICYLQVTSSSADNWIRLNPKPNSDNYFLYMDKNDCRIIASKLYNTDISLIQEKDVGQYSLFYLLNKDESNNNPPMIELSKELFLENTAVNILTWIASLEHPSITVDDVNSDSTLVSYESPIISNSEKSESIIYQSNNYLVSGVFFDIQNNGICYLQTANNSPRFIRLIPEENSSNYSIGVPESDCRKLASLVYKVPEESIYLKNVSHYILYSVSESP